MLGFAGVTVIIVSAAPAAFVPPPPPPPPQAVRLAMTSNPNTSNFNNAFFIFSAPLADQYSVSILYSVCKQDTQQVTLELSVNSYCTIRFPSWLRMVNMLFPTHCSEMASYWSPLMEPVVPMVVRCSEVYICPPPTTAASLIPSEDEAMEYHPLFDSREVHVMPESVDVYIGLPTTAASLVPSEDEAMDYHHLFDSRAVQVAPESVDVYIWPPYTTAASLVPSEDEAMEYQYLADSRAVQLAPESVDVYI